MRGTTWKAWIVIALLLLVSCRRPHPSDEVVITCDIAPSPVVVGTITAHMKIMDGSHPVSAAIVSIEGDMTHPGMAPVFGNVREVKPGEYEGSLNLTMPGDWVMLVHLKMPDGRHIEHEFPLRGVQESGKTMPPHTS